MSAKETIEIKRKIISENILALNTKLDEIGEIKCVLTSLQRSIDLNSNTGENSLQFEISEILRKSIREIGTILDYANDKTDTIGYEIGEILEESEEDIKRLARSTYAFINNSEIDKAKKGLEKIIAE